LRNSRDAFCKRNRRTICWFRHQRRHKASYPLYQPRYVTREHSTAVNILCDVQNMIIVRTKFENNYINLQCNRSLTLPTSCHFKASTLSWTNITIYQFAEIQTICSLGSSFGRYVTSLKWNYIWSIIRVLVYKGYYSVDTKSNMLIGSRMNAPSTVLSASCILPSPSSQWHLNLQEKKIRRPSQTWLNFSHFY
jgi:hypothetical protein